MEIVRRTVKYVAVSSEKAYKLLNSGALVIVGTLDQRGIPNLAPVAWHAPLNYDPDTKLLMVLSSEHKTLKNILDTNKFVVCLPHASQVKLVKETGDFSGHDVNKIKQLGLDTFLSEKFKFQIPVGIIGYLECEQYKAIEEDDVTIVFGRVINASADQEAFSGRLLSEKPQGKTLHHLGGKIFMIPGDEIIK